MATTYTINQDALTIRDVMTWAKAAKTEDIETLMTLMDKCVITSDGSKMEELPARHLKLIITAITKEFSGTDSGN
jgi:hypothetical protein